jgi:putative transposase
MSVTNTILLPENYYHVYNHGNADDNIFKKDDNYIYFLKCYAHFINPVASIKRNQAEYSGKNL